MTRKDRPPGSSTWGPEDDAPGTASVAVIVQPGYDDDPVAAKLRRLHDHYGYFSRAELGYPPARFTPPSSYSLTAVELARHIRQLRRSGWQSWEVRVRFDSWTVADAA